jgi:hypothetical protein
MARGGQVGEQNAPAGSVLAFGSSTWTRLADEHEALIAGGNVAAAPAGQQQQQIQPKDPQPDDH